MKLWVLRREGADWEENSALVIRAISGDAARALAASRCGKEGSEPWLDPDQSSCAELPQDGPEEIVVLDNVGA